MNLPELSVNRPVTVTMAILIIMVLGAVSFGRLGLDFFPDLEFPEVVVITTYTGASPEEMETLITRPLEEAVATVSGVSGAFISTGAALGPAIAGYIFDATQSYQAAFTIFAAASILAIFAIKFAKPPKKE